MDDLLAIAPAGGFKLVYADPPWAFKVYSKKPNQKGADRHYNTMSLADIEALPVAKVMARDSALAMWTTWPFLPQALRLMDAWGFEYKTGGAWAKQSTTGRRWAFGTGYIFRSASEPLVVGARGKPKWLSRSERNLWVAPIREHSRKPTQVHEMLERSLDGPYLEMFGRSGRPGWTVWGNETDRFAA